MSTLKDFFNRAGKDSSIDAVLFFTNNFLGEVTVLERVLDEVTTYNVESLGMLRSIEGVRELAVKGFRPIYDSVLETQKKLPESERPDLEYRTMANRAMENFTSLSPLYHAIIATSALFSSQIPEESVPYWLKGRLGYFRLGDMQIGINRELVGKRAVRIDGLSNVQRYIDNYSNKIQEAIQQEDTEMAADLAMGLIGIGYVLGKIIARTDIPQSRIELAKEMQANVHRMSGLSDSFYVRMNS